MKKQVKVLLSLLLVAAILVTGYFVLKKDKVTTVGVLQFVQHPALDAAREGFVKALEEGGFVDGKDFRLDYQNGQASQDTSASIADKFVADKVDLMLGIATPAVLALAGKSDSIPILGTAVTDYVEARLVNSNEAPGLNVSGTTDMNPVEDQIALLLRFLPEAKTIGLLYTGSEINSQLQARLAKAEIERLGLKVVEITVNSANDVQQAAQSLAAQVDAIYLPTDNIIASTMPIVAEIALAAKIPLACGEANMVNGGGTFTLGIDYYQLGRQTGEMAVKLLKKEAKIGQMPIQRQENFEYLINQTFCQAIGLTIPEDLQGFAKEISN